MKISQEHKLCKCGNPQMISNYNPKSEEVYESCDVCGYYHTVSVSNLPKEGSPPEGWKPEYKEAEGETGFVAKIFVKDTGEVNVACIEKKNVGNLIKALKDDSNVERYAITYKAGSYYITQIYNKSRYRITELPDGNDIDNYNIYHEINAESEIDALKKVALAKVDNESKPVVDFIKGLGITLEDTKNKLIEGLGIYFTDVKEIKRK